MYKIKKNDEINQHISFVLFFDCSQQVLTLGQ